MHAPGLKWPLLLLAAGLTAPSACNAQAATETPDPKPYLKATPEDMRWWTDARFGMFIHWGPVSIKGTEIGWSRGPGGIPFDEYDSLYKQFNPTKFDARKWVSIAKAAGMKYLVFTTKHHDGFCEFDSKLTDYKITNSPFKRDVVAELAKACHDAGLRLGFYYSPPDWHHPDYKGPHAERSRQDPAHVRDHARYIEYLHGQIRELCTNYGRVDVIWFDGLGGSSVTWNSEPLFKMIRELQPHIIINNRAGLPADFDTPEQTIGKFQNTRPWESCITICQQWAYKPNDQMKSLEQCLQTLIRCAGGDGNLLFNVGPMPTGEIEPRQVARLKEMGDWLGKYGESIYGTRGGPYKPGAWGAATCKGNTVYLHLFRFEGDAVTLPALPRKVVGSKLLTGGQATVNQTDAGIEVRVPAGDQKPIDTLVALTLDGPAETIPPVAAGGRSGSLATGKKATASNVFQSQADYTPDKAFDDDEDTRWATDGGTHAAWIQVDLGAPKEIAAALFKEEYAPRVEEFALQYKDGDQWKTIVKGTRLPDKKVTFAPVTAQVMRLNILKANEGPTISEIHLLPPGK